MTRYLAKRTTMMAVAMFLIILLIPVIMHVVPGDPFTGKKKPSAGIETAMDERYHLNDSLPLRFVDYLKGVIRRDFGPSYKCPGETVNKFIVGGSPVSAKFGGITIVFVLSVALPVGICAIIRNGRWQDMPVMAFTTVGVTIPSFVITSFLIYFLAFKLDLLPTYGIESWKGYTLPVIALGGCDISYIARLMKSSLLETMRQDYIRMVRAKGLSEFPMIMSYALRNALIPVITVLGPMIANLMTGSFVVGRIFAIPGLGVHLANSVSQRDYTIIMGVTIFYATFLVVMTMAVNIFYCLTDLRIKYN